MKETIIFLFLIFFIFDPVYCHKCGTDLIRKKPSFVKINSVQKDKRKLSSTYTPIKIKVDLTYIKSQKLMDEAKLKNLENLFSYVTETFSSIISIEHKIIKDDVSDYIKKECEVPILGEGIENWYQTYDIIIFPQISDSLNNSILAAATPCLLDNINYRPYAGVVLINKNLTSIKYDYDYYMKNLLFHELTHVLGFHPYYFEYLKMKSTETIDGKQYTCINTPKVLEKAKIHFGCDTIKGIPLENQGGAGTEGSHWETRYMLGDYMIGADYTEIVISDISLALLEDTGFYKINYYTGGLFRYGKNQGCSFFQKKCVYNKGENTLFPNEFCVNDGEAFCSSSHIAKGDCFTTRYREPLEDLYRYYQDKYKGGIPSADYCPASFMYESDAHYFYPKNCKYGKLEYSQYGEIIGDNSLCFESSLLNTDKESICYKMTCDRNNKKMLIYIGDNVVTCPGSKCALTNPSGLNGEINCPDYNMVCTTDIWCNDMFDCINKKSTADSNTYEYLTNKQTLLKRDQENSQIDDSNNFIDDEVEENKSNKFNKLNLKKVLYFLFSFLLFI